MAKKDYDIAKKTVQDEILAKIESTSETCKPLKLFGYKFSTTASVLATDTVLDVTGKGELYDFAMKSYMATPTSNGYAVIKVEIDGQPFVWTKAVNADTEKVYFYFFFGDSKSHNVSSSTTKYEVVGTSSYISMDTPYTSPSSYHYSLLEPSEEMQTIEPTNACYAYCLLSSPIKFNESLKITYEVLPATTGSDGVRFAGAYTLDEE